MVDRRGLALPALLALRGDAAEVGKYLVPPLGFGGYRRLKRPA